MRLTLFTSVSDRAGFFRRKGFVCPFPYGVILFIVLGCLITSNFSAYAIFSYLPMPVASIPPSASPIALSPEEVEWIHTHPVVTFAVDEYAVPNSFRDQNGHLVGIHIDYIEWLTNRVGLRVRFEGSRGEQALNRVLMHEVDGVVAAPAQEKHQSELLFSEPYGGFPRAMAVYNGENPFNDLSAFSGRQVAAIKNSPAVAWLQKTYPGISVMPVDRMDDALVLLSERKVDGVYDDLVLLQDGISRLLLKDLRVEAVHSDPALDHVRLGINHAEPVLHALMNKAIASMTVAENRCIQDKWRPKETLKVPDNTLCVPLQFAAGEVRWLQEHPVIRVAVSSDFFPVEFEDQEGRYRGISLDYLEKLGELLHVRFDVIQDKTDRSLIDMGMYQEVDVLSAQGIAAQDNERFVSAEPYFKLPIALYALKDYDKTFRDLHALNGKTVAVVSNTTLVHQLEQEYPEIKILPASNLTEALDALQIHKADALAEDYYRMNSALNRLDYPEVKIVAFTGYEYNLSFGVRKDWPLLVQLINKALRAMPNEERRLIRARWLAQKPQTHSDFSKGWGVSCLCVLLVFLLLAKNYRLRVEVTRRSHALKKANESLQMEIATRKQVEIDGLRLEEQLAQAQKMESIGRLAGGVAHDFNNILAVILGHAELLTEDCPADSVLQESLEEIMTAGMRAQDLTRQLLAFSRKQVLEVKTLDLNKVVRGMEKMLGRLLGEDIKVHLHLNAKNSRVKGDISQLEQVLLNLCVNARDAMPDGGIIAIETTITPATVHFISTQSSACSYLVLSVSDTGSGIDEAIASQIFDPFFTTKEKGKGTGLGLSTVYGIVKQHGGEITVHSEPGRGATFRVYLPLVMDAVDENAPSLPTEALRGRGEIVLVVEDEPPVRKMVGQMLARLGYTVIEAGNADECIAHATREELIHLLLVDVVMPEMSGRQLHEHVQLLHPAMHTLFMSGYTDEVIQYHGMLKEDVHFISKPFTERKLGQKIRDILDMTERVAAP